MKFDWRSSVDPSNEETLVGLQERMASYYAENSIYYDDIDFNWSTWLNDEDLCQQDIVDEIRGVESVLEIGCGKANLLRCYPEFEVKYTGIDFSSELISGNKSRFPKATFLNARDLGTNVCGKFDLVFSHFVIEHVVFPKRFLEECVNLLKPNGRLMIVCPDFMGRGGIPSQYIGLSQGTGREKIARRKYLDAVVTLIDSRIIMKSLCFYWRVISKFKPQFVINTKPTCFEYNFIPDVDAVYLTNREEIKKAINRQVVWLELSRPLKRHCKDRRLIYLKGVLNY